jgi:hypothetical protein
MFVGFVTVSDAVYELLGDELIKKFVLNSSSVAQAGALLAKL